jgi:hypothetical protein
VGSEMCIRDRSFIDSSNYTFNSSNNSINFTNDNSNLSFLNSSNLSFRNSYNYTFNSSNNLINFTNVNSNLSFQNSSNLSFRNSSNLSFLNSSNLSFQNSSNLSFRNSSNLSFRNSYIYTSNSLNTKENILTFTTPLIRTGNSITFSSSYIPVSAGTLTSGDKTINGRLTATNGISINDGTILYLSGTGTDGQIYRTSGQVKIQTDGFLYFISTTGNDCYVNNGSYYGYGFNNLSDKRIKYDIENINNSNILEKFLKIEPKNFKYISFNNNSNVTTEFGFIAQEIEEIFPSSVSSNKNFIPNICQNVECRDNQLIFNSNFDISFLKIDNILSIDKKNVKIINIENNIVTINENIQKSNVFVYGTEVYDFRYIDKMYLFTMNILATQELYKIIQKQQEQIDFLLSKIN